MVCFHVVQRPVERWYIVSVVTSSMRHKRNAWSLKISSLVFQSKTLIYQVKDYMIIRGLSQSSVDRIYDLKSVLCNFIRLFGVFSMALWQTALIKSNMCFIYLFIIEKMNNYFSNDKFCQAAQCVTLKIFCLNVVAKR